MNDRATRAALGERVKVFAGLLVVGQRGVEVFAVGLLDEIRLESQQRLSDIAQQAEGQSASIAQCFRTDVDLSDACVLRPGRWDGGNE